MQDSPLVPITTAKMLREQQIDRFCSSTVTRLPSNKHLAFSQTEEDILFRLAYEAAQAVAHKALQTTALHHLYYTKTIGHPRHRRLYHFLRRSFYWPFNSIACYATVHKCVPYTRNRFNLYRHSMPMKFFPALTSLDFVASDTYRQIVTTPRIKKYLLIITDQFSKSFHTYVLKSVTADSMTKAFVTHWVMDYGPPQRLLSNNRKQFTSEFFHHICELLGTTNVLTKTYHPQTNGQAERYNHTIIARLRNYI